MRLRTIPRTAEDRRECPRETPDEIRLRAYRNSLGERRYLIEARCRGRALGDRDFASYADALAFGQLECRWHDARLVDECHKRSGSA